MSPSIQTASPLNSKPPSRRLGVASSWIACWLMMISTSHLWAATPPVAADDYLTLNENTQCCSIAVLANDSDPNNLTLSVSSVTQPAHGTSAIYVEDKNTVTYTPTTNFTGTDTFTYTIKNSAGATATATVHVTVTGTARLTVLPLGDSITWGYNNGSITPWLGYRIRLLNDLVGGGIPIQYMGSDSTGAINSDAGASLNEGHVGYQIIQITHNLSTNDSSYQNLGGYWLTGGNGTGRNAISPQVVLVHIGTNDATSGTESAASMLTLLQGLLGTIQSLLPNAQVFVASLIPRDDSTNAEAIQEQYNAGIPALVTSMGSKFHFVDMHTNFPSNGITPSVDPLHPNQTGYNFMADQWYAAVSAVFASSTPTAPAAPTSLSASAISSSQINLRWTDNSNNETGFAIEQSPDGSTFTQIGTVGANITSYAVTTGLQPSTPYYFRVRAFVTASSQLYSAYTNIANATTASSTTPTPTLNFSSGFAGSGTLLQYNSNAQIVGSAAQLTDGTGTKIASVWSKTVQNIQNFSTQFTFQQTNASADGMTFAIQNNTTTTIGGYSSALAYGGIPKQHRDQVRPL